MLDNAFVHTMIHNGQTYIYDVNNNKIVSIPPNVDNQRLQLWGEQQKLFTPLRPKSVKAVWSPDYIRRVITHSLTMLILNVTDSCNMRCTYCSHHNQVSTLRINGPNKMDFSIACQGIKYLINHSANIQQPILCFYGGEPFLEFDLIRKTVEYLRKLTREKQFLVRITTNGTLLDNEEIAEWVIKNQIMLAVSLDGPQQMNDKERVFADNTGTFNRVLAGLRRLYSSSSEYYKNNVMLSMTLKLPIDLKDWNDFLQKEPLVSNAKAGVARFAVLSEVYDHIYDYVILLSKMLPSNISIDSHAFIKSWTERNSIDHSSDKLHITGCCVPGAGRLFVDVDGGLYPCERGGICSSDSIMYLGDIDSGVNLDRVMNVISCYEKIRKDCDHCWCVNMCTLCYFAAFNGSTFSEKKLKESCETIRTSVEAGFRAYIDGGYNIIK